MTQKIILKPGDIVKLKGEQIGEFLPKMVVLSVTYPAAVNNNENIRCIWYNKLEGEYSRGSFPAPTLNKCS